MPSFPQRIKVLAARARAWLRRRPRADPPARATPDSTAVAAVAAVTSAEPPVPESIDVTPPRYRVGPAQFLDLRYENSAGSRTYKLYLPGTSRGEPLPLIVMLHGCTQSADDFAIGTRMNELAEQHALLVAYPQQTAAANRLKCWNWYNRRDQRRDGVEPSLIAGITQAISVAYPVDRERVYVAGASAGAGLAAILGATYPDVYAAIGVHSGIAYGLADGFFSAFALMKTGRWKASADLAVPKRPIPTIVFHGEGDPVVHPRNADRFADNPAIAACSKRVERGQTRAGLPYTRTTYDDARGEDVLEQWIVEELGHAWSGGNEAGSYTDPRGPDASREFVRFFLAHRLAASEPRPARRKRGLRFWHKDPAVSPVSL